MARKRGTPLLQLPPAEFQAAMNDLFGPDVLAVPCPFCGQSEGNFCETPGGRVTIHAARKRAASAT